jgi:hypothetical protein
MNTGIIGWAGLALFMGLVLALNQGAHAADSESAKTVVKGGDCPYCDLR